MKENKDIHQIVNKNINYVKSLANQYRGQGIDFDDLVSEGYLAMMDAAQKFDESRGTQFIAYAGPFIRKAMQKAVELQTGSFKLPKDIKKTAPRSANKAVSIDAPLTTSNHNTLLDILANKDAIDTDESTIFTQLLNELKAGIDKLDDRERQVVQKFYGIGCTHHITLAEIGEDMGLKRERVRQIRDKAVRKMSKTPNTKLLKTFLKK